MNRPSSPANGFTPPATTAFSPRDYRWDKPPWCARASPRTWMSFSTPSGLPEWPRGSALIVVEGVHGPIPDNPPPGFQPVAYAGNAPPAEDSHQRDPGAPGTIEPPKPIVWIGSLPQNRRSRKTKCLRRQWPRARQITHPSSTRRRAAATPPASIATIRWPRPVQRFRRNPAATGQRQEWP